MKRLLRGAGSALLILAAGCGDSKPSGPTGPASSKQIEPSSKGSPEFPDVTSDKPGKAETATTDSPPIRPSEPAVDNSPLGKTVLQLIDANEDTRTVAEQALIDAGPSAIPALLSGLTSSSPDMRRAVAYFLLESFQSSDDRISAAFREALSDDDRKVRQLALQAVKRMPPEAMALAVPKIAGLLDSAREEPINRADAARLLGKLQSEAREVLPALIKTATADPSEKVRAPALFSVTRVAEPAQALPILVKSLGSDRDASVRLVAATGLGRLGPIAAPVATDLAAALDDRDEKVRRAASDALVGLEEAAVLPLVGQLESANPRTREIALYTLGRLGSLAKSARSAIENRTQDEDAAVRALAESISAALRGT